MTAYDNITLRATGLVTQPDLDWQNRPTFQQVVDFPTHRPRSGATALASAIETAGSDGGVTVRLFLLSLAAVGPPALRPRRRRRRS